MKVLYLDESGDHSLDKIDKQYPVFVLGGVIVDRAYSISAVESKMRRLKREYLGDETLILHTADIVRAKNGFEMLDDPVLRADFYAALNLLMRELDYKVIACVIRKEALFQRFGESASDPYLLSLNILVDWFCEELGDDLHSGLICTEKRGPKLDAALEDAWHRLLQEGTGSTLGGKINRCIVDLSVRDKRHNIAGLQLADLVVSPIGRAVTGRKTHEDWNIVQTKLRWGASGQRSLVVIPED